METKFGGEIFGENPAQLWSDRGSEITRQRHWSASLRSIAVIGRGTMNSIVLGLGDSVALAISLGLAGFIRYAVSGDPILPQVFYLLIPTWILVAFTVGLLPGWGLAGASHLKKQIISLTAIYGAALSVIFFIKIESPTSRFSLGFAWLLSLILVPLFRFVTRTFLCRRNTYGLETVIVGRADSVKEIISRLKEEAGLGYIPTALYTDQQSEFINGVPVLGDMFHVDAEVSSVIIASTGLSPSERENMLKGMLTRFPNIMILPELGDVPSLWVSPCDLGGIVGFRVSQTLLNPFAAFFKRTMDLLLVSLSSPIWLPLCSIIATAIWLEDRRSSMFKQERIGLRGRKFFCCKFRTMVPDAENVLKKCLAEDPELRREWEANCKLMRDPRITKIGHILRRTSLDEIPQLFNVLKGDMALVGPRPLPHYHEKNIPRDVRDLRAHVRPGLTGLWQVSGRSDAGNAGMVRWDPYYVRNWSPWLDLMIIVRTVRVVLLGSGAR